MEERPGTPYWRWVKGEGLPDYGGHGLEDVRELELAPWPRLGGRGAIVGFEGMEGYTGMYVAEIPPGGSTNPERHIYEELVVIVQGHGITELWQDGGAKQSFEWGEYSLFAPPVNTWHRLHNGTQQPVRYVAMTSAPLIMDLFDNPEFVFNCDFQFSGRYDSRDGFFKESDNRYVHGRTTNLWVTNFIADLLHAAVDAQEVKGAGTKITQFEPCGNALIGHIVDWPAGRYHKAHYHGGGAVLFALRSEGYVLLWPKELGVHPYSDDSGDDVVEMKWKKGSLYCPPSGWFHQHFNTSGEPARQVALRYGSRLHPLEFELVAKRRDLEGVLVSIRNGGTMIDHEDEDPQIRQRFEAELRRNGVGCTMPPVTYRSDLVLV
ncbi:MAG TPA: cupin domain-containing protein [Chloroflexota bacterium]|nr:cupin domain-containing protein [Chloroflexota bacterium]